MPLCTAPPRGQKSPCSSQLLSGILKEISHPVSEVWHLAAGKKTQFIWQRKLFCKRFPQLWSEGGSLPAFLSHLGLGREGGFSLFCSEGKSHLGAGQLPQARETKLQVSALLQVAESSGRNVTKYPG